jgi:hypothetical protein
MKGSGNRGTWLLALLCVLGVASCVALPASAGADSAGAIGGMTLVFAGSKAQNEAGNVAVPVTCLGDGHEFCSGEVTLSHQGHHISIPFSVRGGGREVLFVPLRLHTVRHPRRVHGVATTIQPRGPATSAKQFLYAG